MSLKRDWNGWISCIFMFSRCTAQPPDSWWSSWISELQYLMLSAEYNLAGISYSFIIGFDNVKILGCFSNMAILGIEIEGWCFIARLLFNWQGRSSFLQISGKFACKSWPGRVRRSIELSRSSWSLARNEVRWEGQVIDVKVFWCPFWSGYIQAKRVDPHFRSLPNFCTPDLHRISLEFVE